MNKQRTDPTRKAVYRKLKARHILTTSFGCFGGISLITYLSSSANIPSLLIPSFGATCMIAIVTPNSTFAQPCNIIGGHSLSSLIGILCASSFGDTWWSLGLAVGLAAATMQWSRTVHPPAAADPIVFMMSSGLAGEQFMKSVLGGSLILVAFFYLFHKWLSLKQYPQYWY
jgi:CBS-domain-containing membrane protein